MTAQSDQNNIVIYRSDDGQTQLQVQLEQETVWLTQKQLAELFDVKVPAISKHVRNILSTGELENSATVSKMERVAVEGGRTVRRKQMSYNLDMVLSVGYRVNSSKATRFRQWATRILRDHIVKGYSINKQRLRDEREKLLELQQSVDLLTRTLMNQELVSGSGSEVLQVIHDYAYALTTLDRYDHGKLVVEATSGAVASIIRYDEAIAVVQSMMGEFEGLFGLEKDQGFKSALGPISALGSDFNPQNTQCIPAVKIFTCLELEQKF